MAEATMEGLMMGDLMTEDLTMKGMTRAKEKIMVKEKAMMEMGEVTIMTTG
jgi:hypothetical protein